MRVLIANFKHLYQRHGLWIVYGVWVLVVSVWVLSSLVTGGLFGGFLLGSFLVGLLVGTGQMETSSRPFTFGLPGHRDAVRRLVFLVGPFVSLAFLLVFVVLLRRFAWRFILAAGFIPLGAYLCASVAAYLLGADVALGSTYHSGTVIFIAILALAMCAMLDVPSTIQYPILHWPVAVIVLALAVGLASWWWLGRRVWFRRSCSRPSIGFFDTWDRTQIQQRRATRFTKNIPAELDRFFQGRISNRRSSDLGKRVWGALYTTCVLRAPQWKVFLTAVVMMVVSAAYLPPAAPALIGIVIAFLMTGFIRAPVSGTLLVTGGRKERFFTVVTLLLALSAVSVLLVGVLIGLTHWLAPRVPPVIVKGVMLRPHPIDFKVLLILLALFPITSLLWTLFYERPAWGPVSGSLLSSIMMLSVIQLEWHRMITPGLALSGTVLSWAVCVPLLYRIAMRSDLGRK